MEKELIYQWNESIFHDFTNILVHDETLRDGLQGLGIAISKEGKKRYVECIKNLPIASICLGFPASGQLIYDEIDDLIRHMRDNQIIVNISCASRTEITDIVPIVNLSQKHGVPIKVNAFIGTSQIRQYVEKWDVHYLCSKINDTMEFTDKNNLHLCLITEDTTRTAPEILKSIYGTAIEKGCKDICFCDTVGYADYTGIKKLMKFAMENIICGETGVVIEWHGHNDRGLALVNALFAAQYGAKVIHTTGFGIGERCGNTPLELFILNYIIMNKAEGNEVLRDLGEYCNTVAEIFHLPIPENYPVWGKNAFRTVSGVHAAAIYKALNLNNINLAENVYSFIAPSVVGKNLEIGINYMSGKSNVLYWLKKHNVESSMELISRILKKAKMSVSPLSNEEIWNIVVNKKL